MALQRSEGTALLIVRPLGLFRSLLWPAIVSLNGLGNLVLRLCGLRPGAPEDSLHSPEELKLLIAASQEAGLLQPAQQELVDRILSIGNRRITDIMTPRVDVEWVDADNDRKEILKRIAETVRAEGEISRRRLSREVCEWMAWRSANGRLQEFWHPSYLVLHAIIILAGTIVAIGSFRRLQARFAERI